MHVMHVYGPCSAGNGARTNTNEYYVRRRFENELERMLTNVEGEGDYLGTAVWAGEALKLMNKKNMQSIHTDW